MLGILGGVRGDDDVLSFRHPSSKGMEGQHGRCSLKVHTETQETILIIIESKGGTILDIKIY